jgi:thiosulfate dehydrogenase (quinone) large subunit
VSRRARGSRRAYGGRPSGPAETTPWSSPSRTEDEPGPSLREQLESASLPARALLPLRFFFGATFLYAGVDKLIDPTFFNASNPSSIGGQLTEFAKVSPIAPLVRLAEPFAIPVGILIALAEIAIGLGALSGLAFRLAAIGGALLSFTFWLTASWATHPYYYGADLPYAFGWVVLAIAGHLGLLVPRAVLELGAFITDDWPGAIRSGGGYRLRDPRVAAVEASPTRRHLLQAGVLGVAAVAVASLSIPLRLLREHGGDDNQGLAADAIPTGAPGSPAPSQPPNGSPSATGSSGTSQAPSDGPSAAATTAPSNIAATPAPATANPLTVATIASVDKNGVIGFRVPTSAPAPLPAGDAAAIVKLNAGGYAAYDLTCTHNGCRVGWDSVDKVLLCPCHGAAFDPQNHAAVLGGPTNQPLLELPLIVDTKAGTITLKA